MPSLGSPCFLTNDYGTGEWDGIIKECGGYRNLRDSSIDRTFGFQLYFLKLILNRTVAQVSGSQTAEGVGGLESDGDESKKTTPELEGGIV